MSVRERKTTETRKIDTPESGPARYRIGAVSRLTGISPDTLRIWERRYDVVTPLRSPRGGRLYSVEDVARLRLIRELVDAGDTIGEVANLDIETLQGRLDESHRPSRHLSSSLSTQAIHLLLVGETLSREFRPGVDGDNGDVTVTTFRDSADFEAHGADASGTCW